MSRKTPLIAGTSQVDNQQPSLERGRFNDYLVREYNQAVGSTGHPPMDGDIVWPAMKVAEGRVSQARSQHKRLGPVSQVFYLDFTYGKFPICRFIQ